MPKFVPAPFNAHRISVSFSGRMDVAGVYRLGTYPMHGTSPESTLTTTAPTIASHARPCIRDRCQMPPCSHKPAPTLGRDPRGTVTPAAIAFVMISPVVQPALATTRVSQPISVGTPSPSVL